MAVLHRVNVSMGAVVSVFVIVDVVMPVDVAIPVVVVMPVIVDVVVRGHEGRVAGSRASTSRTHLGPIRGIKARSRAKDAESNPCDRSLARFIPWEGDALP
jgi:hypothetical protein